MAHGTRTRWELLMEDASAAGSDRFRHAALLYRTPDELATGVVEFVQAGISAGAAVLVASTGHSLRFLRGLLDGRGARVAWEDLSGMGINPRRITAAFRLFAEEHAGQAVRCVQEPAWRTRPPEVVRETLRHEALLNLALAHEQASVLCAYHHSLPAGVLAGAERTHPMVMRDGRWQVSQTYRAGSLIPAEWDEPLAPPPAAASTLDYRDNLAVVRRFAATQARRAGLAEARVADLVIAVSELAANTLAHTSGPGTVTMWQARGEVLCQVHDSGEISDPLAGTTCPDPTITAYGHGLWVVHQLCDLVETRTGPGGTTTRLHMNLSTPPH
jgi:anti-sigma regulatory factor (Ser/Thr protein kinase)